MSEALENHPDLPFLMISGHGDIETAVDCIKKGAFDYILLETTGLADPGNLAPLFWVDDGLGSTIYLDGIVTLVDAKNILDLRLVMIAVLLQQKMLKLQRIYSKKAS